MSTPSRLLVVDDEPDLRTLYELTLLREGHDVDSAGSVAEAWARLLAQPYALVITDMRLPDGTGLDLLRRLETQGRTEKTLVITAYGSAENAVEALKAGAFDYLTKPVDLRQFRGVVAAALGRPSLVPPASATSGRGSPGAPAGLAGAPVASAGARTGRAERREAGTGVDGAGDIEGADGPGGSQSPHGAAGALGPDSDIAHPALQRLAGQHPSMQQVRALILRVARGMAPVLVQGESGTGKELAARAIHEVGGRAEQPFVAVNCSAIPDHLLEAEFFGYRKGAFTGAQEDRAGFFQAAQGGTLFLDEIGDLPLAMQSKLLRAIQERAVRPVGAVTELPVNVRIISATHKDLAAEVQAGRFRQDLYYRLNVIQLHLPALRERAQDLPQICASLLDRIARDAGVRPTPRLGDDALARLATHAFPGNVRELENLLHRAVALTGAEVISASDLGLDVDTVMRLEVAPKVGAPDARVGHEGHGQASVPVPVPVPVPEALAAEALPTDLVAYLDAVEREVLLRALARHRFNRTAAGASLGLSLRQMRYRMARLGVQVDQGGE